jgi:ribosome maturation factor RimP
MEIKEKIIQTLQNYLENDKYFIVDIKVSLSKIHSKVLILIDSDAGISIDECSIISRKLGQDLDEIMPEKYTLEVSSPGIDVPLTTDRMYRKNIGRSLKIILIDGKELKGKLETIDNQAITIIEEKKRKKGEEIVPMTIPLNQIKTSKVIISFK